MSVALLAELKRRRVFRALAAYAIVAFAVLQVIEPVIHGLRLPDWTLSFAVVALGVGLPIVLVLAWIFDLGPGGIERIGAMDGEAGSRLTGRRVALLLAAAGIVAAAPLIAWHFAKARDGAPSTSSEVRTPAGASVAVLPFVNLSRDKDDEYFSDGITEDVINALANVEGVRVVSRTSAFAYKGKNLSVRKIGEELRVSTALEGSVRRDGHYLRTVEDLNRALALFRKALEVDPNYSLAHAGIADCYVLLGEYGSEHASDIAKARTEAHKALELDATLAEAHATLGLIAFHDYDWKAAEAEFKRAIGLRSGYATAHHWYALLLTVLGRFPEARAEAERAVQLDPASLVVNNMVGVVFYNSRD